MLVCQTCQGVLITSPYALHLSNKAALELADESASVSNVTFVDLDLDATDVGGTIVWDPPASRPGGCLKCLLSLVSLFCSGVAHWHTCEGLQIVDQ